MEPSTGTPSISCHSFLNENGTPPRQTKSTHSSIQSTSHSTSELNSIASCDAPHSSSSSSPVTHTSANAKTSTPTDTHPKLKRLSDNSNPGTPRMRSGQSTPRTSDNMSDLERSYQRAGQMPRSATHDSSMYTAHNDQSDLQESFKSTHFTSNDSLSECSHKSDGGTGQPTVEKLRPSSGRDDKKSSRLSQMLSGVTHKSKAELFKKLFKDMPGNEQLIVDCSCALHRDILVHGRLYLSQNWFCFYANIIGWETLVTIEWTDITAITKEKTARVIPNAIQMYTKTEKYFFTTFVTREHAYTALFRIWQNALLGQPVGPSELKRLCKSYRKKSGRTGAKTTGPGANNDHDETGDEALEEDDDKSSAITSGSQDLSSEHQAMAQVNGDVSSTLFHSATSVIPNTKLTLPSDEQSTSDNSRIAERLPVIDEPDCVVSPAAVAAAVVSTEKPPQPPAAVAPPPPLETQTSKNDSKRGHGEEHTQKRHIIIDKKTKLPVSSSASHHGDSIFKFAKRKKKKKRSVARQSSYHLNVIEDLQVDESTDADDETPSDQESEMDESVLCLCHDSHTGTEFANEEFNFDVDAIFEHLFSQDSDFNKRVYEERNWENWRYSPLTRNADGSSTQSLDYTLHLNYSIGPKTADTCSKQTFQASNKPGSFYTIDVANTSNVPYGDSFVAFTRYCITRAPGNRSQLKIHGGVTFTKRVFGLVKNMIVKNADEAMKDNFDFLATTLRSESDLLHCAPVPVKNKEQKKRKLAEHKLTARRGSILKEVDKKNTDSNSPKKSPTPVEAPTNPSIFESSSWLRAFIGLLVLLVLINFYLFNRLRSLESSLHSPEDWLPKELPENQDGWHRLLEYQKNLHSMEMNKFKEVIGNTALLVKHVESSIGNLYAELEKGASRTLPNAETIRAGETGPETSNNDYRTKDGL